MSNMNIGGSLLRLLATAAVVGATKVASDVEKLMGPDDEESKDVRKASTYNKDRSVKGNTASQSDVRKTDAPQRASQNVQTGATGNAAQNASLRALVTSVAAENVDGKQDEKYRFLSGKNSYDSLSVEEKTKLMGFIRAAFELGSDHDTLIELKKLLSVNRVVTKTAFELCDDERIDLFIEKWYY